MVLFDSILYFCMVGISIGIITHSPIQCWEKQTKPVSFSSNVIEKRKLKDDAPLRIIGST